MENFLLRRAIFLDRDGVLNYQVDRDGVPVSPRRVDDFRLIETAVPAVRNLSRAGFLCIVITNQPDLGRGLISDTDIEAMHYQLKLSAPIDAIYVCGHIGSDGCECRKPKPGMILRAEVEHDVDLTRSWLIGDRWVDIAAANEVGVKAVLVEHGYSMSSTSAGGPPYLLDIEAKVRDLASAAKLILGRV